MKLRAVNVAAFCMTLAFLLVAIVPYATIFILNEMLLRKVFPPEALMEANRLFLCGILATIAATVYVSYIRLKNRQP
jgi:hypothetical protein